LLHSAPTLSEPAWPGKLSPLTRPADERPPESAPVTVPGRELGTRSSQSTVVYLRRNEAGLFADTSKVRSIFSVNGSLTEGEGRFQTEVFDLHENMAGSFDGTAKAKRIVNNFSLDCGTLDCLCQRVWRVCPDLAFMPAHTSG